MKMDKKEREREGECTKPTDLYIFYTFRSLSSAFDWVTFTYIAFFGIPRIYIPSSVVSQYEMRLARRFFLHRDIKDFFTE